MIAKKFYDVFISYGSVDEGWMELIGAILERNDLTFFIDKEGLRAGPSWFGQLEEAVAASRSLIVLATHGSVNSEVVGKEVACALRNGVPVIPVVVNNAPVPDSWGLIPSPEDGHHLLFVNFEEFAGDAALNRILDSVGHVLGTPTRPLHFPPIDTANGRTDDGTIFEKIDVSEVTTLIATANVAQHPCQSVLTAIENMPAVRTVHLVVGRKSLDERNMFNKALCSVLKSRLPGRTITVDDDFQMIQARSLHLDDLARLRIFFDGFRPGPETRVDITGGTAFMSMVVKQVAENFYHRITYTVADQLAEIEDPVPAELRASAWSTPCAWKYQGTVEATSPATLGYAQAKGIYRPE